MSGYSGYFSLYDYPVAHLPQFDLTEKRDIYTPGGLDCPSLFDDLATAGIRYECYNYHGHTDAEILALAPERAARTDARVLFLYLVGPRPPPALPRPRARRGDLDAGLVRGGAAARLGGGAPGPGSDVAACSSSRTTA